MPIYLLGFQFVRNAAVYRPAVNQLPGGHIEEYVYQNGTSNWSKEYAYA